MNDKIFDILKYLFVLCLLGAFFQNCSGITVGNPFQSEDIYAIGDPLGNHSESKPTTLYFSSYNPMPQAMQSVSSVTLCISTITLYQSDDPDNINQDFTVNRNIPLKQAMDTFIIGSTQPTRSFDRAMIVVDPLACPTRPSLFVNNGDGPFALDELATFDLIVLSTKNPINAVAYQFSLDIQPLINRLSTVKVDADLKCAVTELIADCPL